MIQHSDAIKIINLQIVADSNEEDKIVPIKNKKYVIDKHFDTDLWDSEVYDEDQMSLIIMGIIQNIAVEMDKQGFNITSLARNADLSDSHVSRVMSGQRDLGLKALIKIAAALHVNPTSLFPMDCNSRKTNGQRFDEITKGIPLQYSNYYLDMVAGLCNLYRSNHGNNSYYSHSFDQ